MESKPLPRNLQEELQSRFAKIICFKSLHYTLDLVAHYLRRMRDGGLLWIIQKQRNDLIFNSFYWSVEKTQHIVWDALLNYGRIEWQRALPRLSKTLRKLMMWLIMIFEKGLIMFGILKASLLPRVIQCGLGRLGQWWALLALDPHGSVVQGFPPCRVRETFEINELKSAPSQLLPVFF